MRWVSFIDRSMITDARVPSSEAEDGGGMAAVTRIRILEPGRAAIQSIPNLHLPHPMPISESQIRYRTIAEHEPRDLQAASQHVS
jgi:hypothetical protein